MTNPTQPDPVTALALECAKEIYALNRGWACSYPDFETIIAATLRPVVEERDRLREDNESLRTLWTEIRTVLIQSRAANCICSYGAQQADAVEAANAVLKRMPPDITTERDQLRAALDTAEGALKDVKETTWVATVDEAMRGGNTPACAAESMRATADQALARIAELKNPAK